MVTETPGALIASHSHIRGLGVDLDTLTPRFSSQGLVGQERARKAAALIIKMVEERKIAGRAILIAGPPSTGKTAIAMGMVQTLGSEVPFVTMSGSEIYSKEISKTEALTQAFRKGVAVRVSEETEFIEGEVVEIQLDKSVTQANRQGRIIMKTNDMESAFNLGPKLIDSLEKEHVIAGDIISVNMSSNRIVKLGRSYARSRDYDAMGKDTKFVTCPDGELRKRKEETHIVSLHEIDVINSRPQGYMGLFSGDTGEIPSETRDQINVKVDEWKEEGKADLLPGVLFIDEVHMLDVEAFSFMNKWTENELSPIIIMASNRGNATVRGTPSKAPHGMPLDFLDRCVIISTHPYNAHELQEILKIRAQEEEVELTEGALALLTKVAEERGLRYGSQLIATSFEVAKKRKGGEAKVDERDVERAYGLFLDPKRSVELLTEDQGESMELS